MVMFLVMDDLYNGPGQVQRLLLRIVEIIVDLKHARSLLVNNNTHCMFTTSFSFYFFTSVLDANGTRTRNFAATRSKLYMF